MNDEDREVIKAFVRANLTTRCAEAEYRVRSVRLTTEELIYAWYCAGTHPRGGALKTELMNCIYESKTFDDWALIATKFSLAPYRAWAKEQLRRAPRATQSGIALLARSKSHSLRKLAEELRPKLQVEH